MVVRAEAPFSFNEECSHVGRGPRRSGEREEGRTKEEWGEGGGEDQEGVGERDEGRTKEEEWEEGGGEDQGGVGEKEEGRTKEEWGKREKQVERKEGGGVTLN